MEKLVRVRLVGVGGGPIDTATLAAELPTVSVELASTCGTFDPIFDCDDWTTTATFRPFDEAVRTSSSDAITVRGPAGKLAQTAVEVLTRWQRHVMRRNRESTGPLFDAVLRAHEGLHDRSKPLVEADFAHALDTWQWMLRLDPGASVAAQLAALFHDVERLESEADRRVEHNALDYQAFKDAHARRGGDRAYETVTAAGIDDRTAARVRDLVARHEKRAPHVFDAELRREIDLLNDADGLSFFSLNSAGYADYFGQAQTRRKIAYTLRRLSRFARRKLAFVKLRPDVQHYLFESEAA